MLCLDDLKKSNSSKKSQKQVCISLKLLNRATKDSFLSVEFDEE